MRSDEYKVDKYGEIHNKGCSLCRKWFIDKKSKYGFIRESGWKYCESCFCDDEETAKLEAISKLAIEDKYSYYLSRGLSSDEAMERLRGYEWTDTINAAYSSIRKDEYIIRHDTLHNNGCRLVPWPYLYSVVENKYAFEKRKKWMFCPQCFKDGEIKKMMEISDLNLGERAARYRKRDSKVLLNILKEDYDWKEDTIQYIPGMNIE